MAVSSPPRIRIVGIENVRAGDLEEHPKNWREHPFAQRQALRKVLEEVGIADVLIAYRTAEERLRLIDGHLRRDEEPDTVWPVLVLDVDDEEAEILLTTLDPIAAMAQENAEKLRDLRQSLAERSQELDEVLDKILGDAPEIPKTSLLDDFGVPPFSLFDSRQATWQERKRAWLSFGLRSDEGRGKSLLFDASARATSGRALAGTSIFDPVLAEILYNWFTPPGSTVLDPFAGGSVRGVVAAARGRVYRGVDLRAEQVEANQRQWTRLADRWPDAPAPEWTTGDSREVLAELDDEVDLVFSCPPYADLERYSDDPDDLSTMGYDDFLVAYREIIGRACGLLRADRFAAWVVGEIRDDDGLYRGFVRDTLAAFEDAGLHLYNDAILLNMAGSAPLRARRIFLAGRKLVKLHQNVLIFVKGDPRAAAEACGHPEGLGLRQRPLRAAA